MTVMHFCALCCLYKSALYKSGGFLIFLTVFNLSRALSFHMLVTINVIFLQVLSNICFRGKKPKFDKIIPLKNSVLFLSKTLVFENKIVCIGENPEMPKIVTESTPNMTENFGCIIFHNGKINEQWNFLNCYQEKLGNSSHSTKSV